MNSCGVPQSAEESAVSRTVAGSTPAPAAVQTWADRAAAISRNKRPKFTIERDSIAAFYEVHQEYALHTLPTYKAPRVLDLGANAGVFSWMVFQHWPDATVTAYEPHPDTYRALLGNTDGMAVEVINAAVTREAGTVKLYEGRRNRLCCSTLDLGDQDVECSWEVAAVAAVTLPPCDVLKVDTEGAEVDILETYQHLATVKCVLVECHSAELHQKVVAILSCNGLTALDQRSNTVRFVR